jgi:hypothetical protein
MKKEYKYGGLTIVPVKGQQRKCDGCIFDHKRKGTFNLCIEYLQIELPCCYDIDIIWKLKPETT